MDLIINKKIYMKFIKYMKRIEVNLTFVTEVWNSLKKNLIQFILIYFSILFIYEFSFLHWNPASKIDLLYCLEIYYIIWNFKNMIMINIRNISVYISKIMIIFIGKSYSESYRLWQYIFVILKYYNFAICEVTPILNNYLYFKLLIF